MGFGFLSDIFDYQKHLMKDMGHQLTHDPERLLLGINNPVESKVWGGITGKKYEPTMDMFGGPTEKQGQRIGNAGVNTGPGESMHSLARAIAAFYAGSYGADKLGLMGGSAGSSGMPMGVPMAPRAGAPGQNPNLSQAQEIQKQMMADALMQQQYPQQV